MKTILVAVAAHWFWLVAHSKAALAGCVAFNAPQSTLDRFTVEQHQ